MSAQVKLASKKPGDAGTPSRQQGNGGASQSRPATRSSRSHWASSSSRAMASACTRAASSSVAGPSVAVLSPGGLIAPASETWAVKFGGPGQPLSPVGEQVGMRPDDHRQVRQGPG